MKIFHGFIITIIGVLLVLQPAVGQNSVKIESTAHAKMFSERLSAYINSQDGKALLLNQRATSNGETYSSISQTYEHEENYILIGIGVFSSPERAIQEFDGTLIMNSKTGYKLSHLGDEAIGKNTGTVRVRKGNVVFHIYINSKDNKLDASQSRQQPLTEEEKRAKEELEYQQSQEAYNQLMKEPWVQSTTLPKRVPNYSPEHKLAQQFAKYVLDFMEQYSKDQGGIQ